MRINFFLFNDFETLDALGPAEILGEAQDFTLKFYSLQGGLINSVHGVEVMTEPIDQADPAAVLLVPGGIGTRPLLNDPTFLKRLHGWAEQAAYCLSVCTGSALLGACGILDHRRATSNKLVMSWVKSLNNRVKWVDKARWVVDGKFYTASGVSAGMDMALAFVSDRLGRPAADKIATYIEYRWHDDSTDDPFAQGLIDF